MDIRSGAGERGGCSIRAREAEHLMTRADEFLNDGGADEARRACDENTHMLAPYAGPRDLHPCAPKLIGRRDILETETISVFDRLTEISSGLQVVVKMAKKRVSSSRKPRSDAQRNRERLLEVAKEAFTRSGATTSLDDIAKQAGVGPGTLYRHFPTRDELLEAVYRSEVEKLAAAERKFADTLPPLEALRAWMLLFVDLIATKRIIAPALNTMAGGPSKVFEASHAQTWEAIRSLVRRAIKSGDIRKDLDPIDLLRALIGVANVATSPDWQQSARRLVDILINGSRPLK